MRHPVGTPDDDLADRLWAFDEMSVIKGGPAIDVTAGLVSMRFMKTALRRRARVWCLTTVLGLVVGMGLYVKFPPAYHATTSVLLVDSPGQDPAQEVNTDVALATSTAVAANVVKELKLTQSVPSLLAAYTVTPLTDQVLIINVGAPTSGEATQRAAAIAEQFLQYRARYTETQLQQAEAQLNQQLSQAKQTLASVKSQISQTSDQAKLSSLQDQETAATNALAQIRQYVTGNLATLRTAAASVTTGSQVLNTPVPIKPSSLKGGPLYIVGGIFGGLALGMVIVLIGAITSDKLRRRGDISYTFGAPVRLSVGPLRKGRWPGARGAGKTRERDIRRVVDYLRDVIPGSSRGPAGLAVAAVDDVPTVAEIVVELASDTVGRGRRVMLADLSEGRLAATRLGVDKPGIHTVNAQGRQFLLIVPEPDDVAPVGPLRSKTSATGYAQADEQLFSAARSTDFVLALVTLDPAFGSEYLPTLATDVVGVVTAGLTPAAKISAAGELIRLAGTRLDSVVLLDAEPRDESLGVLDNAGLGVRV
jgi:capsular polysaccharide biosynthesis protein